MSGTSKEIRTRTVVKDIRVLDKAASGTAHMKDAFVRTKQAAEDSQDPQHRSGTEYATDRIMGNAKGVAEKAANGLKNPHKKAAESLNKATEQFKKASQQLPKARKEAAVKAKQSAENAKKTADTLSGKAQQAQKAAKNAQKSLQDAKRGLQTTRQAGRQAVRSAKQGAKLPRQAEKTVKTSAKAAKATGRGAVKTVKKSVKTAEQTAKMTVKTAQKTAKAAQQSAKVAAKAAKVAMQAAKIAAKTAVHAAKAAARATIAMVKAAIAAIKGLIAAIAAGGWIALLIILIICLIGLLVGSIFGIFFSGEDSGTGKSMPDVVSELTTDFYTQIEEIKAENPHDVADVDPMAINWQDVLAVYAVKANTDPANGMDVATLDDEKAELLRGVLNDMASLSYYTQEETQERVVESDDGEETTEEVEITVLYISLTQKSADDMAAQYGFSQTQKDQLAELRSPDYASLWAALIGGAVAGDGEILIGNPSHVPLGIFSWPMAADYPVNSPYGYRPDPFNPDETKFHSGIDIACPEGTPIIAAADGTVTAANATDPWGGGWGFHVSVQHDGTFSTLYAHCSRIAVINGQTVQKGQVIGYVGTTGNSTGNHLHFEVYANGARVNPLDYFG